MPHAGRRKWRLFYLALFCGFGVSFAQPQAVTLTTISDVVFRADGTPASGTLLISWPAFVSADGHAVAAGNKSVILASMGASACNWRRTREQPRLAWFTPSYTS